MDFGINTYIAFWIFIIGLCFGSFYNVVICRFFSNESIILPASKCPKCQHKLYFWQNIPLLSYILLGGKCHFCKEKISIQYPLVELLTAVAFLFTYLQFGLTIKTLFIIVVCSCFIIMTATDIKEKVVDCKIAIIMAVIGIIYNFSMSIDAGLNAIYGLIAIVIIFELFARLGYLVSDDRAFGEADTYVAAAIGACFGLNNLLTILIYSLAVAMLFILPRFFYQQIKNKNTKILILSILFALLTTVYKLFLQNYFILALLLFESILLISEIIKSIKIKKELTYLPFVPALAFGTIVWIFVF